MKRDLYIPRLTSNDESIRVVEWLVQDGAYVQVGQSILLVETSKTNVEIESEFSGYIRCGCTPEQILSVAENYAILFDSVADLDGFQPEMSTPVDKANLLANFSNAALKYIEEHQLNPADFQDLGLVNVEKIKAKLESNEARRTATCSRNPDNLNTKDFPNACTETVPFSKLSEIANLSKNKEGVIVSSLTVQLESQVIREHLSEVVWLNRRILPYILYVFSRLLTENPYFLSYYQDKQIVLYNKINLGLAIDLGKGLRVMVIEDPQTLSVFDIQMELVDRMASYHENSMNPSHLQASTVTVTDLSQDNILHFQPVLNANQSVILGIGGDQSLPGSPLTLTLAFDHRVLSGQTVALFLKQLKERLLSDYRSLGLNVLDLMESAHD